MLNTSGFPVESVAPVRSASADISVLGAVLGPTGFLIGVPPSARPITEIPSVFSAAIVSVTVAAPAGATAPETVLPLADTLLLTNPNRLTPIPFEQRSALEGTVAPPLPVTVPGIGCPAE